MATSEREPNDRDHLSGGPQPAHASAAATWFQPARAVSAVPGKRTLSEALPPGPAAGVIQRKEAGPSTSEDPAQVARAGIAGPGGALPFGATIQALFGRHDVSGVVAHSDAPARAASGALGAHAYAVGHHVAFAGAPDLHTAAHEAAHVVQQRHGVQLRGAIGQAGDAYERHADAVADRVVAGHSAEAILDDMAPAAAPAAAVQRKEVNPDAEFDKDTRAAAAMTPADWTTADRVNRTAVWTNANLVNLLAADVGQYRQIVERRDFYLWFYTLTAAMGCATRWALAAYVVADGAHQVADMDDQTLGQLGNAIGDLATIELQGAMREGNEAIFNNVLPKLRDLYLNARKSPVIGQAALTWDMKTLAEEQSLIQPMYDHLSPEAKDKLAYIAKQKLLVKVGAALTGAGQVAAGPFNRDGAVPAFPDGGDMTDPAARWRYGMELGNQFAPGGTGYTPAMAMPTVGADYQMNGGSNRAFDQASDRPNLHVLDAYLNPNHGGSRTGPNQDERQSAKAYLTSIISRLTPFEKSLILADRMPDGHRYSTAFGDLGVFVMPYLEDKAVDDAQVIAALPAGAAIDDFLARFHAAQEAHRIYPQPLLAPTG
jgi:hypothetical protein